MCRKNIKQTVRGDVLFNLHLEQSQQTNGCHLSGQGNKPKDSTYVKKATMSDYHIFGS
ncbi:uncharacterized protein G2W53_034176 [Senna tora]|uniref:Uncharacterized protein n=1 Tax=Senna tora TaxID=362788 RepID=A0A834W7J1_9FABA|nr:uncharacterized protein G2W53_034176 [Senna tora]